MTTIDTTAQLTLVEMAKRINPNGESAIIAEILNKVNPILQDAPWKEANNILSHEVTRRASIPTGTKRRINQGVDNESSRTVKVREGIMMLETYSDVDEVLIDNDPNPKQARMTEATAFLEGLSQTAATSVFYGNASTDPEDIDGFATRMPDIDADGNVINEGGEGSDESSVYVVMWDPAKVFMVYPRGSKTMGITRTDKGKITLEDGDGKKFEGYRDHFKFHCGLAVKDSRCIARLANIDPSGTHMFDEDNLITLLNRMPEGKKHIYVNARTLTQMEISLKDKTNVNFTPGKGEGLIGDPVMYLRGNPVKKCEAILSTEDAIT